MMEQFERSPYTQLYVRILAFRKDCHAIMRTVTDMAPSHGIWVIDPLWDSPEQESLRYIHFNILVREREAGRDPALKPWQVQPPLREQFLSWLQFVRERHPEIGQIDLSDRAFPL